MTDSTSDHRQSGRLLLKVGRLLFDEAAFAAVVLPTIADLQQEVEAAGESRGRRLPIDDVGPQRLRVADKSQGIR